MREVIIQKLKELEVKNNVQILFACESGSRAWGFASPDSDYDVRFIYKHPREQYLSINEFRDVIELPVNEVLDISGWDLRKTFRLLRKSNAVIFEWLQSPIIYLCEETFHKTFLTIMEGYFSPRAALHHYLGTAKNSYASELQGTEVKLKKYFYALRPLLAAKWITEKKTIPPMEFSLLRKLISDDKWNEEIDQLMEMKKISNEKGLTKPIEILQSFIAESLTELDSAAQKFEPYEAPIDELNELFRSLVE